MRLIDADKLKKEVLMWMPSDPCGIAEKERPIETDIVVSLMMEIEDAPTIDVIPVVRCEDCALWEECKVVGSGVMNPPTDEDDYCSWGIRREDGET